MKFRTGPQGAQGVRSRTAWPCSRSAGTDTWSCTTSQTPSIWRKHAVQRNHREVVEAFLAAARDGDFDALVAVLDPDIVLREDTGSGTTVEVRGAENVARRAKA